MSATVVRRAGPGDLRAIVEWLDSATLPTADLTADRMCDFLVAEIDGVPAGCVGLERYREVALLRSLIVERERRGAGIGVALVAAAGAAAAKGGMAELWLLTIDADGYFANLGFEIRNRADAPAAIRNSGEFTSLCPGDAVLMSGYSVRVRSQSTS